jgi:pimeloyl-ACP methyl ester carboxylesterase
MKTPAALFALVLLACRSSQPTPTDVNAPAAGAPIASAASALFDYDATKALDVEEDSVTERRGVRIVELSYASPRGGRVTATLTAPIDGGAHTRAALRPLGLRQPARVPARGRAVVARRRRVPAARLSLGASGPVAARPGARIVSDPELDRDVQAQAVVDLRRGLDLLCARSDVDPAHIAYVGHSYGAQWGAILSAIDDRVRAAVLVAGVGRGADLFENDDPGMRAFVERTPREAIQRHIEVNSVLDAVRWVPHAAPTPLLFQFAAHEPGYSVASMERYFAAASEPKEVRWYFTGHELNDPQALVDRVQWLKNAAGLPQAELVLGR